MEKIRTHLLIVALLAIDTFNIWQLAKKYLISKHLSNTGIFGSSAGGCFFLLIFLIFIMLYFYPKNATDMLTASYIASFFPLEIFAIVKPINEVLSSGLLFANNKLSDAVALGGFIAATIMLDAAIIIYALVIILQTFKKKPF